MPGKLIYGFVRVPPREATRAHGTDGGTATCASSGSGSFAKEPAMGSPSEMKSVACGHDDAHLAFSTYCREIRITHVGLPPASREKINHCVT